MNQNLIWIYVFKKNPESDTVIKHVIQASIAYEHLLMAWLLHCKSSSVGLGGKAVVDDSSVRAHATHLRHLEDAPDPGVAWCYPDYCGHLKNGPMIEHSLFFSDSASHINK